MTGIHTQSCHTGGATLTHCISYSSLHSIIHILFTSNNHFKISYLHIQNKEEHDEG